MTSDLMMTNGGEAQAVEVKINLRDGRSGGCSVFTRKELQDQLDLAARIGAASISMTIYFFDPAEYDPKYLRPLILKLGMDP